MSCRYTQITKSTFVQVCIKFKISCVNPLCIDMRWRQKGKRKTIVIFIFHEPQNGCMLYVMKFSSNFDVASAMSKI